MTATGSCGISTVGTIAVVSGDGRIDEEYLRMTIQLEANQYGKAENRVVRIYRDTTRHEIRDLNVSSSLRGDFEDAHVTGDQAQILPTDTQKNTAFAFAKEHGVTSPEDYAITLGKHFLQATPAATGRRSESRSTRGTGSPSTAPGTTTPSFVEAVRLGRRS
jgi:urate oxidase